MDNYINDEDEQNSIITGEKIPRDEIWQWVTTWRRDTTPRKEYDYGNTYCMCGCETREFFEMPSLGMSSARFRVCHKCATGMIRRQWYDRETAYVCPVCGFPCEMSGHGLIQCTFGHTWKLSRNGSRIVVNRSPIYVEGYGDERKSIIRFDNDEDGDARDSERT